MREETERLVKEAGRGDRLLVLFAVSARVQGAEFDGRFGAFLLVLVLFFFSLLLRI